MDASGNPNGFTVMLYSATVNTDISPGSSLGTLTGSLSPISAGTYTYTPASSLILSPGTDYFIVLTAGTAVASGGYWLSQCAFPPSSSGGWNTAINGVLRSSDGTSGWSFTPYSGIAQFAITATPVPEPGVLSLLGLGGLCFLWQCRKLNTRRVVTPTTLCVFQEQLSIMFVVGLLAQQITHAQGTIYLSNLGEASVGGSPVGSDSPNGFSFITGQNAGGYLLDSIQLSMTDASGNPSGFAAMMYMLVDPASGSETYIGTLSGSLNPAVAGIYAYTPTDNLILLPNTYYSLLLTAETAVANGAYELSLTGTNLGYPSNGWAGPGFGNFSIATEFPQYAITATPVPEPGTFCLFGLGGLCFLWHRRKAKTV